MFVQFPPEEKWLLVGRSSKLTPGKISPTREFLLLEWMPACWPPAWSSWAATYPVPSGRTLVWVKWKTHFPAAWLLLVMEKLSCCCTLSFPESGGLVWGKTQSSGTLEARKEGEEQPGNAPNLSPQTRAPRSVNMWEAFPHYSTWGLARWE